VQVRARVHSIEQRRIDTCTRPRGEKRKTIGRKVKRNKWCLYLSVGDVPDVDAQKPLADIFAGRPLAARRVLPLGVAARGGLGAGGGQG